MQIREEEELLKCNSLEEGIRYLKYKELFKRDLTLEEYRTIWGNGVVYYGYPLYWGYYDSSRLNNLFGTFMEQIRKRSISLDRLDRLGEVLPVSKSKEKRREKMWGRKAMAKIAGKQAAKLASKIDKGDFLAQLKEVWRPHVRRDSDIEEGVKQAMFRIDNSEDFKVAFTKIGVTEEDVRTILTEIKEEKPEQVKDVVKIGRNELCPCGSGKKYKKCCGK